MTITVEATYENGVLKLAKPLPLPLGERERVRVSVEPGVSWTDRSAGILKWRGDLAELERLALEPQFDPQEGARISSR